MDQYFDFDRASQNSQEAPVSNQTFAGAGDEMDDEAAEWRQLHEAQAELGFKPADSPCAYCRERGLNCYLFQFSGQKEGCCSCAALGRTCSFLNPSGTRSADKNRLGAVNESACSSCHIATGNPDLCDECLRATQPSQKPSGRFSKTVIRILKGWMENHASCPYPTEEEKTELERQTGLKRGQISNWLANARRRGKHRSMVSSAQSMPMMSLPANIGIDIPKGPNGEELSYQDLNPLDRWKVSPPEHEPASVSAIARAVANTPQYDFTSKEATGFSSTAPSWSRNDSNESSHSIFNAPSQSSFDSTPSTLSDFSFISALSHPSSGSFEVRDRKFRRRRRRNMANLRQVNVSPKDNRIFECTFCTETFATKYDWQRHEKSLHIPLEKWICSPAGGIVLDLAGKPTCVFCGLHDPDTAHLDSHDYKSCADNPLQERTFYRKDHMAQHLRLVHNCKFTPSMHTWKSSVVNINSRCGFCSQNLSTWPARIEHLAAHFKAGQTMANWTGDWGFDSSVLSLIENAMPPYMIAYDRHTMNPFRVYDSASAVEGSSCSEKRPNRRTNCWVTLEREMTKWVKEQLASGIVPTDEMLQRQGRLIIFGCDDSWNQTGTDNPVWLAAFKKSVGLADMKMPEFSASMSEIGISTAAAASMQPQTRQLHRTPSMQTLPTPPSFSDTPGQLTVVNLDSAPGSPGAISPNSLSYHVIPPMLPTPEPVTESMISQCYDLSMPLFANCDPIGGFEFDMDMPPTDKSSNEFDLLSGSLSSTSFEQSTLPHSASEASSTHNRSLSTPCLTVASVFPDPQPQQKIEMSPGRFGHVPWASEFPQDSRVPTNIIPKHTYGVGHLKEALFENILDKKIKERNKSLS